MASGKTGNGVDPKRAKRFATWDWVEVIQCTTCRWYLGGQRCKAYAHIPEAIWEGDYDHRNPYPGDGGIRYERRKD